VKLNQQISNALLLGTAVTSVAVTPFFSYDPINVPRFLTLLVIGLVSLGLLIVSYGRLFKSDHKFLLLVSTFFIVWSGVILLVSKINLTEGLFGVTGRQTGFLTYVALIALMVCTAAISSKRDLVMAAKLLVISGWASGLYGLIQIADADPFDWINPYSPVFGLFGNPNFHASFMGICAVVALVSCCDTDRTKRFRWMSLIFVPVAVLNIYESKSQQGFLVLMAGIFVFLYLYIQNNSQFTKLSVPYVVLGAISLVAVVLDILQKSPWKSFLYKESVTFRGDFWRAGWKMTTDNPIFGVGPDGYRDQYRLSRDLVTAMRPGSDVQTDSAHNVFLDLSASGGLVLLVLYILIIAIVLKSAYKIVKREKVFNPGFTAVIAAWVAYTAQSVISINQIGLAVWGWVLSGLIIGYEINTREATKNSFTLKSGSSLVVPILAGFVVALSLGMPLMVADTTFRSTIKSGDVLKIESSVRQWPKSVIRMTTVAQILREGNLPDRSIVIAREAVAFNPMNYEAWRELSLQPNTSESERNEALKTMKKLDPFNPNLK
jgi:O-antigen ligase